MFQENRVLLVHEYMKDGKLNSVREALIYADRLRGCDSMRKKIISILSHGMSWVLVSTSRMQLHTRVLIR